MRHRKSGRQLNRNSSHRKAMFQNMTANPDVRLELEDRLYELRAERVTDEAVIETFGKAWTDQSFFRRDPAALDQVWLYRLIAR